MPGLDRPDQAQNRRIIHRINLRQSLFCKRRVKHARQPHRRRGQQPDAFGPGPRQMLRCETDVATLLGKVVE